MNSEVPFPGPGVFPEFDDSCPGGCAVTECNCIIPAHHLWSTIDREAPDDLWVVFFAKGVSEAVDKRENLSVRAVRGGS